MSKIDLELVKELAMLKGDLFKLLGQALRLEMSLGNFCKYCGEMNPENGFYPLIAYGPESISGLMCNSCARQSTSEEDSTVKPAG